MTNPSLYVYMFFGSAFVASFSENLPDVESTCVDCNNRMYIGYFFKLFSWKQQNGFAMTFINKRGSRLLRCLFLLV